MPRTYSMSALTTMCQRRVDMEGDPSVAPDEWAALISEAYGELYSLVFEAGMAYFETTHQYTTTGTNVLAEQVDQLSVVGLFYLIDATNGRYIPLKELMSQERGAASLYANIVGSHARFFAMVNRSIYLYPTPPAGQVYELRYVPQPADLTTADTAIDVVTPDGLAFLVWNVAVMVAPKTDADPQLCMQRLEAARGRFLESVQLRALNQPRRTVSDVETGEGMDGYGWGDFF